MKKDRFITFKVMMALMTALLLLGVALLIMGLSLGGERIILSGTSAL